MLCTYVSQKCHNEIWSRGIRCLLVPCNMDMLRGLFIFSMRCLNEMLYQGGFDSSLDTAKVQFYHFTTIIIAGMGFFTDAYDLFCISNVTKLLTGKPSTLPPNVSAAVNGVALCGTLAGQLFFGWLGDKLGRKKVYGITLMLMVVMSIASGLSFGHTAKGVMTSLCFFKFWLGFGIGGDYPLSAVIMSEYSNTKTRGSFVAAVFAMQGTGILVAAVVSLAVAGGLNNAHPRPTFAQNAALSTASQADYAWRIIFMMGAILAALTFYWRMRMPETARYTALVQGDVKKATADMTKVLGVDIDATRADVVEEKDSFGVFSWKFARKHGIELLGTTTTWFFLDIAFYSQNLFQKDVLTSIGWLPPTKTMSALSETYRVARAQALIALCSTVPGYWVTVALIDRIGRKPIQLLGFFFMTAFMFAIAIPYDQLRGYKCKNSTKQTWCGGHHTTFFVLYAFTFFFANFGPNATTFIIPAELFPARIRSTCHGMSAAAGKVGAIIGAFGFLYAAQSPHKSETDAGYPTGIGYKKSLILLGVTNAIGFFFTLPLPETKGKSLEELADENAGDQQPRIAVAQA